MKYNTLEDDPKQNEVVQLELQQAHQQEKGVTKVLFLGTHKSGKSTIFKQLRMTYGKQKQLERHEQSKVRTWLHSNVLHAMKEVLSKNDIDEIDESIDIIETTTKNQAIDARIAKHLTIIWENSRIQESFQNSEWSENIEILPYFFDNIDRLLDDAYVPNQNDILRTHIPTKKIRELTISMKRGQYKLYDPTGQSNDRNKWIHCFDNVNMLVFIVSLAHIYNRKLSNKTIEYEEKTKDLDRMNSYSVNDTDIVYNSGFSKNRPVIEQCVESFEEICHHQTTYFANTQMVLLFNKCDLLQERIESKVYDTKKCLPEYTGEDFNYQKILEHITQQFTDVFRSPEATPLVYVMNALDSRNVVEVFEEINQKVNF